MKALLVLAFGVLAAAAPAAAQNDSGVPSSSPGPQNVPTVNINAGGNPTAPAMMAPGGSPSTYPNGGSLPAWRGGTTGSDQTATGGPQDEAARQKAAEDRRRAAEPQQHATPSAPPSVIVSPEPPEPAPATP